jgi:hypothetical protein
MYATIHEMTEPDVSRDSSTATCAPSQPPFMLTDHLHNNSGSSGRLIPAGEQSGEWVAFVAFDCRGLEPVAFHAEVWFVHGTTVNLHCIRHPWFLRACKRGDCVATDNGTVSDVNAVHVGFRWWAF